MKLFGILILLAIAFALVPVAVQYLWNDFGLADLFGTDDMTYKQAFAFTVILLIFGR